MESNDKILCIYHGNCSDGFAAAWVVWKKFSGVEFHAGVYGEEPPDCTGKRVILVDFSYKPEILKKMSENAKSILILDHHISSIRAIEEFKNPDGQLFYDMRKYTGLIDWDRHLQNSYQDYCEGIPRALVYHLYDMERSGARMAWDFFYPGKECPKLIEHIEDRDLWRFKLPYTREIQAALFSYPYEFDLWDDLMFRLDDEEERMKFVNAGRAIERRHHKDIKELIEVTKREMIIGGHLVWCANLPYTMASDACHEMCKIKMYSTPKFAASYYDKKYSRVFSLRSIGDFDVSEIAKKYGGGGHKNAAGFTMPIGWEGDC